jgi:hypothetical protein
LAALEQWPAQRARWAHWASAFICAAAAAGATYIVFPAASIAPKAFFVVSGLLAGAIVFRLFRRRASVLAGTLSLLENGLWEYAGSGHTCRLQLVHAWPSWAWATLRFREADTELSSFTEFTIWKASVSGRAWRRLRVHLARQAMAPGCIQKRELP